MDTRLLHKINRFFYRGKLIFVTSKRTLDDCKILAANKMYFGNLRVVKLAFTGTTSIVRLKQKFNSMEKSIGLEPSKFELLHSGKVNSNPTPDSNGANNNFSVIKVTLSKGWLYNRVFLTLALENLRSLVNGRGLRAAKLINVLKRINFKEYFTDVPMVKQAGYPNDHYACLDLASAIDRNGIISTRAAGKDLINSKFHLG